jgi:hypothetical protein
MDGVGPVTMMLVFLFEAMVEVLFPPEDFFLSAWLIYYANTLYTLQAL